MQKVYSKINWENDPSTNTAINEDNLNRMDSAIDTLDDRVVQLAGYQNRVKQSEQNTKESEVNAKQSESKASTHELNAKSYMESAKASEEVAKEKANFVMASTPEGYDELVATIGRMDIQTSTDYEYRNTKQGGLRLLDMVGATVQNGEPSPDNPIAIENTFDVVEMIQGHYIYNTGVYSISSNAICNKNPIPCKGGDVAKISCKSTSNEIYLVYYNENGYMGYKWAENELEYTIPSGATYFNFDLATSSGVTPQTVGKIALTVNGKYVGQIVECGKNFVKGFKAHSNAIAQFTDAIYVEPNTDYVVSIQNSGLNGQLYVVVGGTYTSIKTKEFKNSIELPFNSGNNPSIGLQINITNGDNTVTVPILNKCVQLEKGTVATPHEPYTEKVTTFFLNEPLRATDRLVKVDGVHMENHRRGNVLIDRADSLMEFENTVRLYKDLNVKFVKRDETAKCSHLPLLYDYTLDAEHFYCTHTSIYFFINKSRLSSVDIKGVNEYLANNPMIIESILAEETYTPLDTASQIALNDMETFDGVTYIEVDSKVKPTSISGEYGTSQVGAYTLKCMNDNDTDRVERAELKARLDELAIALVSIGKE